MAAILEKTENRDKDFRYMATSDLLVELLKDSFKPDSDGERKMCKCLLKLINDQSSDVQSLAVKCLSPLVRKVHEERVDEIMASLCLNVLTGTEEQRDICSIGLKTVVLEMPATMATSAIRHLTPQLIKGVQRLALAHDVTRSESLEVKLECLEVLNDLLRRFAAHLSDAESKDCLVALFSELTSSRAASRKRAIACIASLSASLPDRMLEGQLVGAILAQMTTPNVKLDLRRTYIQTLSAISRSGGYRLAKQLDKLIPLILGQCMPAKNNSDPEMIESCLQAFESFVLRCPKEVGAFQTEVGDAALTYLAYDPNYADEDSDGMEADEEEEADDDDDEAEDYSDDDDVSWKVRRAAAKVLSSLILSRPDRLSELLPMLLPTLIVRFNEREENVKMDIFSTFNDLLAQVAAARVSEADGADDAMAVDPVPSTLSTAAMLLAEVPRIIKAAARQLKEKSTKTRIAAFHCLTKLAATLPGTPSARCLSAHAAALIPGIDKALKDASSNPLRIEALLFLQQALPTHPPTVFQPFVQQVLPPIVVLADDRYYKTVAEALRVLSEVVKLLRPEPPAVTFAHEKHVPPLYAVVERRLQANDQDQEVKECAISCMGLLVAHLADHPSVQLGTVLPLLIERMRNEITRITTVKTFALIAAARLDVQLTIPASGGVTIDLAVGELCSFLRKSNRPLRQASLMALEVLMAGHAGHIADGHVSSTLVELSGLIHDGDLHVAHLALTLATTIVTAKKAAVAEPMHDVLLPRVLALLQSSLLQGVALRALLSFLGTLVAEALPALSFDQLLQQLLALPASSVLSRHALAALSQAVAACCAAAKPAQANATVQQFAAQLSGSATSASKFGMGCGGGGSAAAGGGPAVLALLCLGEIGRLLDLSTNAELLPTIVSGFDSPDEETRSAASFALGNIAAGNLAAFVPHLLQQVAAATSHDYLLLHALKEMIGSGGPALAPYVPQLLPKLLTFAERDEEGVRNVVSECLGRLAAVAPSKVVPKLAGMLPSPAATTRATVIACLRFTVTEIGSASLPPDLQANLLCFLKLLEDVDLKVRRGALLTLNCLAHNKPASIKELLPALLPLLYGETAKRPELVHQVDLGPFKHTVDDGLDLRKAAFECMETLLARVADRLEFTDFMTRLLDGLTDDGDIKLVHRLTMLCHRMLIDLSVHPAAAPVLVTTLDTMCEPLRLTLTTVLKDNAVKQQIERHNELLRSAMRAVRALEKMPDADGVTKFVELLRNTLRGPKLADKYAAICEEEAKPAEE